MKAIIYSLIFLLLSLTAQSQAIKWSTYLNTTGNDNIGGFTKDKAGNIYILGRTDASGFPVTPGAFQSTIGSTITSKMTVTKISGATGSLLWSTYLGGDNDTVSTRLIYLDSVSNTLNVVGVTRSLNFPVVNGNSKLTGTTYAPTFTQFNPATGSVLYSTHVFQDLSAYNGYSGYALKALVVDGFAYFVTIGENFQKILVSKINLSTHQFVYQKSVGGISGNINQYFGFFSLGFNTNNGNVYLSGTTNQTDYPTTTGCYQPAYPANATNAYFITKLNIAGDIQFSTFANSVPDEAYVFTNIIAFGNGEIAVSNVYNEGITVTPPGLPFDNILPTNTGILKLKDNDGSIIHFSYLGAQDYVFPLGSLSYNGKDLIITGNTNNAYLPVTNNATQLLHSLGGNGDRDCYIAHLDSGNNLVYCSYFGGNGDENFYYQMPFVSGNNILFVGATNSIDLPITANATQAVNKGSSQGYGELMFVKYNKVSKSITYASYLGTNVYDNIGYLNPAKVVGNDLYLQLSANTSVVNLGPLNNDFPVTPDAFQKTMVGANQPGAHQYLAKINTETGKLAYGSYLGALPSDSSAGELPLGFDVDGDNLYMAGYAGSPSTSAINTNGYPVTKGAVRTNYLGGGYDIYVTKLNICQNDYIYDTLTPKKQLVCANSLVAAITGSVPQLANVDTILRNGVVQPIQATNTNFIFKWQQSTDSINWTYVYGATGKDYQPDPVAVKMYFRRIAKPEYCDKADTSNVSVVDLNGSVPTPPNVGGTDGNFFACPGSNLTLGSTAISGYTYSWQPTVHLGGANTVNPVFNTSVPGAYTYVLSVTQPNGCTALDTATIYNYAANAGGNKFLCQGKTTQIGGRPLAGITGVTYNWTPVIGLSCSTCAQPVVSTIGTYILTVSVPLPTGGNCITKDTMTVGQSGTVQDNPAGPDVTVCNSTPVMLGLPEVAGYNYSWTPGLYLSGNAGIAQPVFNDLNATLNLLYNPMTYVLTVNNPVGCTVLDTVKVHVVDPYAQAAYPGCRPTQMGKKDYTRGQASYLWVEYDINTGLESPVSPGELSSTTISNPIALANAAITTTKHYKLKMSWNDVTCSDIGSVGPNCLQGGCSVNLKYKSPNGCPAVSGTDSVTLYVDNPSPDYIYTWSPSVGLNTINGSIVKTGVTTSTIYICTATNKIDPSLFCFNVIKVNFFSTGAPVFHAPDKTICKGDSASIGLASVAGYSYVWTNSDFNSGVIDTSSNPTVTGIYTRQYYVVVTDQITNCHTYDTVKVTVPTLSAEAGPNRSSCTSGGFNIGTPGTPSLTYSWTPPAGLNVTNLSEVLVVSNDSSIVYYLTATDPMSGCFAIDSVIITHTNTPKLDTMPTPTAYCIGSNGSAQIGNKALNGVQYSWTPINSLSDPAIAQPVASPNVTTIYTVIANFPGACFASDTATVTVTVNLLPTANATAVNNCLSSQLDVTTNAVAPSFYWTPNTGLNSEYIQNPVSTVNTATNYSVNITDQSTGCSNHANIMVNTLLKVDAGFNKEYCVGGTSQIGTPSISGVTYSWTPTAGLSNPNIAQPTTLYTLPVGVYTYTLQATSGTCTKVDDVVVKVKGLPSVSMNPGVTICKNGSVQIGLNAQPGVSYSWSPLLGLSNSLIANPIANPLQTTTYTLLATNISANCSASSSSTVTVNTTGAPVVTTSVGGGGCTGIVAQLNANALGAGPFTYAWTPDQNFITSRFISNPMVTPTQNISYQVLVTNSTNGCSNSETVNVKITDTCNFLPVTWLGFTAILQNGKTNLNWLVAMENNNKEFVVERSLDGIQWTALFSVGSKGNTTTERSYKDLDAAPRTGINFYRIKQVDNDGKFTYSVIRSVRLGSEGPTFVVYPNPALNVLNYELLNAGNTVSLDFFLHGADGKLLKKMHINNSRGSFSIYDLPSGVYVLTMRDNKGKVENKKVVVQK